VTVGPDSTTAPDGIAIRLLAPGDDSRTLMLVPFEGECPVGFVLAHELPRRHGIPAKLFVYEVDVAESHRSRGITSALLARPAGPPASGASRPASC